MLISVLDYLNAQGAPNVQAALDDAKDGDRVYFPGTRVYTAPATGPWVIQRSLEIFGDGPGGSGDWAGTTLVPGGADIAVNDVFLVEPPNPAPSRVETVFFHDFKIKEPPGAVTPYGGHGVRVRTAANKAVGLVRLQRVNVLNLNKNGFTFEGTDSSTGAVERVVMIACGAFGCELAILLRFVLQSTIVRAITTANRLGGGHADRSGAVFYASGFDSNGQLAGTQAQLWFQSCHGAVADACHFEKQETVGVKKACVMENSGGAAWLAASLFAFPNDNTGTVGLQIPAATENGPVFVGPNHHERTDKMVDIAQGTIGAMIMPQFVNRQGGTAAGQMLVPATTSGGDNGALLASPTISRRPIGERAFAGLILPAMTGDPTWLVEDGMIFYDTNTANGPRFRVRIEGQWKTIRVG